jgi:lipopolysaccharide transport system permease protein
MCIGLILTPLGLLYTDIPSALPVIIQFWFFLTPVVYPPIKTFPYSLISTLNPVSPVLLSARDLIAKGHIVNLGPFLIVCLLTFMGLLIALVIYRVSLPIIIERMSA